VSTRTICSSSVNKRAESWAMKTSIGVGGVYRRRRPGE
jgi:hypothetical protein